MPASDEILLTDFYQLTMAYAYWKTGRADQQAVFTLYFRSNPFGGGYSVVAGLEQAIEHLENFCFDGETIGFLRTLQNPNGKPLLEEGFLSFLRKSPFACDVDAIPEGTVAFPNEPIVKVRGPIWQCQWIETMLLNVINFQTLIATKAARMVQSARGTDVIEFGLRRAQGPDGGLSASRAAYIGGVSSTSNLLAAKRFGIPARGTHGHSWVMSFDTEIEAFEQYARALPDNCTLLVDTYDTLKGIRHAIEATRSQGAKLNGVRLDSGDFAYLSEEARKLLDAAGLMDTRIVASNELDETLIQSLRFQDSKIDIWGVGTKLVTAHGQPAMSGVYKLAAIQQDGVWKHKIKVSDQPLKTSNPGIHCIRRYFNDKGDLEGDLIYDESEDPGKADRILDPLHPLRHKKIAKSWKFESSLVSIFKRGKKVFAPPPLSQIRDRAADQISRLHAGHRRLENPHVYPVGLSPYLSQMKEDLIAKHREK